MITGASTNLTVQDTDVAREFVSAVPSVELAKAAIRDRLVCRRSFADGPSVSEYRPFDDRAAAEIDAPIKEVFDGN